MAVDTLVTNKMRSALTMLGVVIGVTSIVGMTSLIRGFGDQIESADPPARRRHRLRREDEHQQLRERQGVLEDLMRRPEHHRGGRASAIKAGAPSAMLVGWQLGGGPGIRAAAAVVSARTSTKLMAVVGASANFAEINYIGHRARAGSSTPSRWTTAARCRARLRARARRCSRSSTRSARRSGCATSEFTVVGVMGKRPSPLGGDPDEFAVIPIDDLRQDVRSAARIRGLLQRFLMIGVVGYPGVPRAAADERGRAGDAQPAPAEGRSGERLRHADVRHRS